MTAFARLTLFALATLSGCGPDPMALPKEQHEVFRSVDLRTVPDDAATLRLLEQAAATGDPKAQVALSGLLRNTFTHSLEESARLYREAARLDRAAAEKGDPLAEVNVGVHCMQKPRSSRSYPGECNDDVEAVRWFRQAMDHGSVRGMAYFGYMTEFGRGGLEKNPELAARYYRAAADRGSPDAARFLGDMTKYKDWEPRSPPHPTAPAGETKR